MRRLFKKLKASKAEERTQKDESVEERTKSDKKAFGDVSLDGNATLWQGDNYGTLVYSYPHTAVAQQNQYRILLDSLTFDRMDARLRNIATALPDTCRWLFQHPTFRSWTGELQTFEECHGFLWIKGKPGSGKSTIMKEAVAWAGKTYPSHLILTYFFNARSPHDLEKSSLGLYRSTLHQVLLAYPDGTERFTARFSSKVRDNELVEDWAMQEVQNFLIELVTTQKLQPLMLFVDALDEGHDDDVRQMISFLEQLAHHAMSTGAALRICLSSRHYPQITIRRAHSIVVESQVEHTQDIATYIQHRLAPGETDPRINELQRQVQDRSAGVFLWVILVVAMLNKLYDQGKSVTAMTSKLGKVPRDLHEVFAAILSRDTEDIDECIALFQWVMFSFMPLQPFELYFAVQLQLSVQRTESDIPTWIPDAAVVMRYLLHCSRGLVELTMVEEREEHEISEEAPYIQFIHETVRDFLNESNVLTRSSINGNVCSTLTAHVQADRCHAVIAETCL